MAIQVRLLAPGEQFTLPIRRTIKETPGNDPKVQSVWDKVSQGLQNIKRTISNKITQGIDKFMAMRTATKVTVVMLAALGIAAALGSWGWAFFFALILVGAANHLLWTDNL